MLQRSCAKAEGEREDEEKEEHEEDKPVTNKSTLDKLLAAR